MTVSPRITGFVTTVAVGDNQAVHTGDIIATIDDRDAQHRCDGAKAELDKARAQLDGYKAAVIQQGATVASAKADITNAEAGLAFATQDAKRYADLLTSGAGTSQRAQQTDADLRQHAATLDKDRAALDVAQKQVKTYEASGGQRGRRHRGGAGQARSGGAEPRLFRRSGADRRRGRGPFGTGRPDGAGRHGPSHRRPDGSRHLSRG